MVTQSRLTVGELPDDAAWFWGISATFVGWPRRDYEKSSACLCARHSRGNCAGGYDEGGAVGWLTLIMIGGLLLVIILGSLSDHVDGERDTVRTSPGRSSDKESLKEMIALMINLKDDLCAKVLDVRPLRLKDTYEVTCIEYRGGSGTVRYIFNARTGAAYRN